MLCFTECRYMFSTYVLDLSVVNINCKISSCLIYAEECFSIVIQRKGSILGFYGLRKSMTGLIGMAYGMSHDCMG